jgi:hypothetical protein
MPEAYDLAEVRSRFQRLIIFFFLARGYSNSSGHSRAA